MNRAEIIARIKEHDANFAIIVTMYKGNPNNLEVLTSKGELLSRILIESAMLRREVLRSGNPRISSISYIGMKKGSTLQTRELAQLIAYLTDIELVERDALEFEGSKGAIVYWFQDLKNRKTLWTNYHSYDGTELGPRIRVNSLSRSPI